MLRSWKLTTILYFQDKLNESLRKITALEAGARSSSSTSQQTKIVENMKTALRKANDENDNLIERLVVDGNSLESGMYARKFKLNNFPFRTKIH